MPLSSTDADAANAGIDNREFVRNGLIAWRDEAMKLDPPPFDGIVLLTHAIWWLADA